MKTQESFTVQYITSGGQINDELSPMAWEQANQRFSVLIGQPGIWEVRIRNRRGRVVRNDNRYPLVVKPQSFWRADTMGTTWTEVP